MPAPMVRSDKRLNGRTGAEEVPISVGIINTPDARPELVRAHERQREYGFFPRVGMPPLSSRNRFGGVRSVFEDVVRAIGSPGCDGFDLATDLDHRVTETIELGFVFALGGLDHQGA